MNLKNGRAVMWPTVLKEGLFLGDFPLLGLKEVGKGEKRRAGKGFVPVWALDNYTAGIETKLQRDFQWER